ncbi:MAG TPA: hypothetical protein VFA41_12245 [Ktedonobacteraceae bacterium]|nr:hypothetical protein [Ktedonobacteraceae bacterium]
MMNLVVGTRFIASTPFHRHVQQAVVGTRFIASTSFHRHAQQAVVGTRFIASCPPVMRCDRAGRDEARPYNHLHQPFASIVADLAEKTANLAEKMLNPSGARKRLI